MKSKIFKFSAIAVMGALLFGIAGSALPALADQKNIGKAVAGQHRGNPGAGLEKALENGVISQEHYDAAQAVQEKMEELRENFADLTPEERRAAMDEARSEVLDELLADGEISQDIYDELIAGPEGRPGFAGPREDHRGAGLEKALENGVISREHYDAAKAVQEKMEELRGNFADLTPEERRAAMDEARSEILDELLAEGEISQDIYDELIAGPEGRPDFDGAKAGFGGRGRGMK